MFVSNASLFSSSFYSRPFAHDAAGVSIDLVRLDASPFTVTTGTLAYPEFPSCAYTGNPSQQLEYFNLILSFLVVLAVAKAVMSKFWRPHEGL